MSKQIDIRKAEKENKEFNLDVIKALKSYLGHKKVNQGSNLFAKKIIESNYFKTNKEDTLSGYPFDRSKFDIPKSREYNQFGESFIYQYIKLKNEVTISCLVDAIKQDVGKLRKLVQLVNPDRDAMKQQ